MIRGQIKNDLKKAVGEAVGVDPTDVCLEHPANPPYGDYSTNVALQAQKPAELIVSHFPKTDYLEKIEVDGPGFINFFLKDSWLQEQVGEILLHKGDYGLSSDSSNLEKCKTQVEFISANPTGPLTAGNARGGFAGDVLARVLSKLGFTVEREYYINDKGVQVDRLAESVKAHYDSIFKSLAFKLPEGGYAGEYVRRIAEEMIAQGRTDFAEFALESMLNQIKATIARMGITFDRYFSEQSLYDSGEVRKVLDYLKTRELTYEKDGAVWLKTSRFGDDKDRVLVKADGEMTYFVSDIAYHFDRFQKRGYDKVILFWGADHHGYVPRFYAAAQAIGHKGKARVELAQLLKLERDGREVKMSKRAGEFVTVDDLLDEIGLDAARFHFLSVPLSTPMTLDLQKAKEQSVKNPVYYVQYAYARICSILAKVQSSSAPRRSLRDLKLKVQSQVQSSKLLAAPYELALIRKLVQFPEVTVDIARTYEVHRLPQYSVEIADAFHRFYENCQVLTDDEDLTSARLSLVEATRIILGETLSLMGISSPERM